MRALLALLLAGAAAPAAAQHGGHSEPPPAPSKEQTCTPEHSAMGHCTMPAPAEPPADPHAGHEMPEPQQPAADPHADHQMPEPEQEQPAADPHAGHDMSGEPSEIRVGPAPSEAYAGPENAGDQVWGQAAMEPGRAVLFTEHGDIFAHKVLIDQLEWRVAKGRDGYFLNAEAWFGGDIDKLWLKTEIEGERGHRPDQAELQVLWSHAIDPWFNLQAGVRLDAEPDRRARLVLGVEGLAPYWIEVDAAAFVSDRGDVTARFEAEHDMRITRKLIVQPRAELDFALQDIPAERLGSGLSAIELGARLRYELVPNFAPYVGLAYERAVGDSARFRRAEGEDTGGLQLVAGLRVWF